MSQHGGLETVPLLTYWLASKSEEAGATEGGTGPDQWGWRGWRGCGLRESRTMK